MSDPARRGAAVLREYLRRGVLGTDPEVLLDLLDLCRRGEAAMGDALRVVVTVPGLRVHSEMNSRVHWSVRRKRFAEHKLAVAAALSHVGTPDRDRLRGSDAVRVRLVRCGGRRLDADNCLSGLKAVTDAVAAWLKLDDGDPRFRLEMPGQEPGGEWAVRVELEAVTLMEGAA